MARSWVLWLQCSLHTIEGSDQILFIVMLLVRAHCIETPKIMPELCDIVIFRLARPAFDLRNEPTEIVWVQSGHNLDDFPELVFGVGRQVQK